MLFKAKKERNEELKSLRTSDPKTWTYKKLGEKYGISAVRARQLVEAPHRNVLVEQLEKEVRKG